MQHYVIFSKYTYVLKNDGAVRKRGYMASHITSKSALLPPESDGETSNAEELGKLNLPRYIAILYISLYTCSSCQIG